MVQSLKKWAEDRAGSSQLLSILRDLPATDVLEEIAQVFLEILEGLPWVQ
jgi:hypothetical protein